MAIESLVLVHVQEHRPARELQQHVVVFVALAMVAVVVAEMDYIDTILVKMVAIMVDNKQNFVVVVDLPMMMMVIEETCCVYLNRIILTMNLMITYMIDGDGDSSRDASLGIDRCVINRIKRCGCSAVAAGIIG